MEKVIYLLLGIIAVLSMTCAQNKQNENIYLESGGYKGIVLAIHPDVEYSENILTNLKVRRFLVIDMTLRKQ